MFERFRRLLRCSIVVLEVVAAVVAIVIVCSNWHSHLGRLFLRAWKDFLAHIGSTGPGFISPVIVSILGVVGTLLCIRFLLGKEAMLKHWWENTAITALVTIVVLLAVYGPQFAWKFVKVIYDDHERLVAENKDLKGLGAGNPYIIPLNNQFAATINTLNAFKSLKENGQRCKILITYPAKSSQQYAAVLGDLARAVGCDVDVIDPNVPNSPNEDVFKPLPETIIVHGQRKDIYGFTVALSNAFNVTTNVKLPEKMAPDEIWVQIGSGVVLRKE